MLTCTLHVIEKAFSNLLALYKQFFSSYSFSLSLFIFCWFASFTFIGPGSNNKMRKELIKYNSEKIYVQKKIIPTTLLATKHLFLWYTHRETKTIDSLFPKTNSSQVQGRLAAFYLFLSFVCFFFCGRTWLGLVII